MKFDKLTIDLIIQYIYSRWPYPRKCQICGNLTWNVTDRLMELRECGGGSMVIGGDQQYMPLVVLTCPNCGYVILFNALVVGISKPISPLPFSDISGNSEEKPPETPAGPTIN